MGRLQAISIITALLPLGGITVAQAQATEKESPSPKQVQVWGEESLGMIREEFWVEEQGLFAEHLSRRRNSGYRQPAFMWSAGVQLSALAAAAALAPDRYRDSLEAYAAALKSYWHEHDGIGGYDVQPNASRPDRYYDDNAWMVLALIETYDATGDRQYLDDATKTFKFVTSGEDRELGGGIYWRETPKQSKNTCSNAPAIVAALGLFRRTKSPEYLETANRLYDWTCSRLQDPETGLFWDHVDLSGRVDRRRFTYNSALMIRANCLLYDVTGNSDYLAEAQRIATSAATHWLDVETGAIDDEGKFAHMLLEAFLAVHDRDQNAHWLERAIKVVSYVHGQLRDEHGHYSRRWDEPARRRRRIDLIDQASAARAFFVVARDMAEHQEN